ncbi:MAG: hypothetical protein AAGC43_08875, partial [Bacteroidota bacterium]
MGFHSILAVQKISLVMKKNSKATIFGALLFLSVFVNGQQWEKNYPEYFLNHGSDIALSEIYNKIKSLITKEQQKMLDEIGIEFYSSNNFQLAYIETFDSKKTIKVNKVRLIELFNLMDLWTLFGVGDPRNEAIDRYFTEYVDYLTYNPSDKILVPPELFFKLSGNDIQRISSNAVLPGRAGMLEYTLFFLIAHEVAHFLLSHTEQNNEISWNEEKEADEFSLELVKKEYELTLFTFPIFLYISSLDIRSNNKGYSQTHPNPELRALEMLHGQFEDFNTLDGAIKKHAPNQHRDDYYDQVLTAILRLLDYFMLNKSFTEEYHLEKANNGEVFHQMLVGFRYWVGYGRWKQNISKADFWLKKASDLQDKNAIMLYAMFVEFEYGNIKLAHKLYHDAVNLGNKVPEIQLYLIHELEKESKLG